MTYKEIERERGIVTFKEIERGRKRESVRDEEKMILRWVNDESRKKW